MTRRLLIALTLASVLGSGSSRTRPVAWSSVVSGFSQTVSAQTRRPLQSDDIFELKTVGDPRISPDGAWVAYTVSWLDRKDDSSDTDIYMVATSGGAPIRLTSSKKPENSPRWSPDGRYLAFLSSRDGKKTQVYLLDRRGGEAQAFTDYKTGAASIAWSPDSSKLALLVPDPDPNDSESDSSTGSAQGPSTGSGQAADSKKPKPHVITRLQFMRDGEGYLNDVKRHIHVFDIATKADIEIAHNRYDDGAPVWAPDGTLVAFSANRTDNPDANDNSDIYVVELRTGAVPRQVTTSPSPDNAPAFSPDGKSIAYITGGDPKDIWYATNRLAVVPVGGGAPTILTAGLDRNVSRVQFTGDGAAVLFLIEEGGNSHLARVPAADGPIVRVLDGERDVNAYDVNAYDVSKTGDVAILQSQPQLPAEVFVVKAAEAGEPVRVTHVNDEFLAKVSLGAVERFKAKSADGTMIDAYLTRPPNAPAGKLPTILRIHGGPVSQFSTGFNLEWQMLAARGFAVVAANPRGSSGYGRDFSRAIFADWGNKDRAAVGEHGALDEDLAVLPDGQDRDADARAGRRRRHERPHRRRPAAVSGPEAARTGNRAHRLSRRNARHSPAELPEGSLRSVHRVVREVSEAEDQRHAVGPPRNTLRGFALRRRRSRDSAPPG